MSSSKDIWYELFDPTTSRVFYANPATGACTWIRPNASRILDNELPEWWELYDEQSGSPYYYNNITKETFWEKPSWITVYPVPLSSADDSRLRNLLGPPPSDNTTVGTAAERKPNSSHTAATTNKIEDMHTTSNQPVSFPPESSPSQAPATTTSSTSLSAVSDSVGSSLVSESPQTTATSNVLSQTTQSIATTVTAALVATSDAAAVASDINLAALNSITMPTTSTLLSENTSEAKQIDIGASEKQSNSTLPAWWDLANPTWLDLPPSASPSSPLDSILSSSATTSNTSALSENVSSSVPAANSSDSVSTTTTTESSASAPSQSTAIHIAAESNLPPSASPVPLITSHSTETSSIPSQNTATGEQSHSTASVSASVLHSSEVSSTPLTQVSNTPTSVPPVTASTAQNAPELTLDGTFSLLPQASIDLRGRPPFDSVALPRSVPNTTQSTASITTASSLPTATPSTSTSSVTAALTTAAPSVSTTSPPPPLTTASTSPPPPLTTASTSPPPPLTTASTSPPPPPPSSLTTASTSPPPPPPSSLTTASTSFAFASTTTTPLFPSHSAPLIKSPPPGISFVPPEQRLTPEATTLTFSQQPTLAVSPAPLEFRLTHPSTVSQTSASLVLSGYRDVPTPPLSRVKSTLLPHAMNRLPPVPPASKPRSASTSTNIETSSPNVTENSKNSEPYKKEAPPPLSPQLKQEINLFQLEDYAKKYFQTARKGVFKRSIPLKNLLKWSKDTISRSLLKLKDKHSKEAVGIFKLLQMYMGDKAIRRDPSAIAQQILERIINIAELRDECYCQVCKQTTLNPNPESTYKGWDIMALLVQYVPPTKDLETFLFGYIREHLKINDEKLRQYAAFCLKKLPRTCRIGARGRIPTIKEIERSKIAPFDLEIFGGTLQNIMLQQEKKLKSSLPTPYFYSLFYGEIPVVGDASNSNLLPSTTPPSNMKQIQGYPLPIVLITMTDAVYFLNGHQTEGIFRVPGDAEEIATMRMQIESGDYTVRSKDPHLPASVLKQWLRDLEEPVVPEQLYDKCIAAAKEEDINKALAIVNEMPDINRRVLHYLIRFLQVILNPEYQQKTKMNINNISMVFAPCILRCPSEQPSAILESSKFEQVFVRLLILGIK